MSNSLDDHGGGELKPFRHFKIVNAMFFENCFRHQGVRVVLLYVGDNLCGRFEHAQLHVMRHQEFPGWFNDVSGIKHLNYIASFGETSTHLKDERSRKYYAKIIKPNTLRLI